MLNGTTLGEPLFPVISGPGCQKSVTWHCRFEISAPYSLLSGREGVIELNDPWLMLEAVVIHTDISTKTLTSGFKTSVSIKVSMCTGDVSHHCGNRYYLGSHFWGSLPCTSGCIFFNMYGKQGKISTEFFLNSVRGSANYWTLEEKGRNSGLYPIR